MADPVEPLLRFIRHLASQPHQNSAPDAALVETDLPDYAPQP